MTKEIVLITGASGFIGAALIERLIKNYYIIGIDKILHKDRNRSVLWYKVDISNKEFLSKAFKEINEKFNKSIDYVFHLAAYYDLSNKKSGLYLETNENGTRYLLDNLINFNLKNFFFTSSTAVAKPTIGITERLNEKSPLASILYYAKSKIAGEKIILEYKEKIRTTIFRLAGVYSNDCRLIPLANQIAFIWQKGFGYRILPGKGDGGLSYVHMEDVLDAFEKAIVMSNEIAAGSIFILSEDGYVSIKELYGLIFYEIYGKKSDFIHLPKWFVYYSVYTINKFYFLLGKDFFFRPWMIDLADKKYRFDIRKAKEVLGWQPKFLLREHMELIIEKLKDNPNKWFKINNIN